MEYRIEQIGDREFIPQVQVVPGTWQIIEKEGRVCYFNTPGNRTFCTCKTIQEATKAIGLFQRAPVFQDEMYPVIHHTYLWLGEK